MLVAACCAGAMSPMFASLDFVYTPAADVDAAVDHYVRALGAELLWKVRAMGTTVAAVRRQRRWSTHPPGRPPPRRGTDSRVSDR